MENLIIETDIKELDKHSTDLVWLSDFLMRLMANTAFLGEEMAKAQLREYEKIVYLIEESHTQDDKGNIKKMSVAEAEKKGVVLTNNEYGVLRNKVDLYRELGNAVKVKIRVLQEEKADSSY